jgi:hypothetical protein
MCTVGSASYHLRSVHKRDLYFHIAGKRNGTQMALDVFPYPFASKEPEESIRVFAPPIGAASNLPRPCGLRAMEAGWISALFGRRAPFPIFRIQIWWDGAQVAKASSPIKSLWL